MCYRGTWWASVRIRKQGLWPDLVGLFLGSDVLTFSSPSSLRLMISKSKSVLKPLVLLKTIRPVKPSHWAWKEERERDDDKKVQTRETKEPFVKLINHNTRSVMFPFNYPLHLHYDPEEHD